MADEKNIQTSLTCPDCMPVVKLVVKTNRVTKAQFIECPNCKHSQPLPEDWKMRAAGQRGLWD